MSKSQGPKAFQLAYGNHGHILTRIFIFSVWSFDSFKRREKIIVIVIRKNLISIYFQHALTFATTKLVLTKLGFVVANVLRAS